MRLLIDYISLHLYLYSSLFAFQFLPVRNHVAKEIYVALSDARMEHVATFDPNQSSHTALVKTFSAQRSTTQYVVLTTLPILMNARCTTTRALKRKQLKSPIKAFVVRSFLLL